MGTQIRSQFWAKGSFWVGFWVGLIFNFSMVIMILRVPIGREYDTDKHYTEYQEWRRYKSLNLWGISTSPEKLQAPKMSYEDLDPTQQPERK